MSILPLHSLIFNVNTTVKSYCYTSFLPSSSISSYRFRKLSEFSTHSSFDDSRELFVPKTKQNDDDSDDKPFSFVDEWGERSKPELRPTTKLSESDPPIDVDEWGRAELGINNFSGIEDEWGEKSFPELRPEKTVSDSDPPIDEDEWIGAKLTGNNFIDRVSNQGVSEPESTEEDGWDEAEVVGRINAGVEEDERVAEMKRCLIDTVYGTDFGLRASSEVRAEALELVAKLEAANPTPTTVELLDGNWILVFTAFSELLPLLAVGTIPLLKVEKISQTISTSSLTIENSTTLSSPVATSSFSATAIFEVQSSSRIQVEIKEGTFKPPEIKSKIDLPENMDIFGQNISLSPLQQSLGPLENVVAGIARTISGLPPLKVPIPGERTKSWLITTYVDSDLRISRGDGGLFVLVKEESSLLDQ
ncbi:plastoglobulin-1, chloroplastic [Solanum lycopersicum]|uniref:Plastid lipid-associated protein/fibrillin conserved domain-containing protein n=1 Tax=Solanum lycopersicum TaxID=4081 RepID=A0A3Q7HJI4_SOLLC|nr:plastoglobulin-1, chloroplastic [Solanum lycopersicum]